MEVPIRSVLGSDCPRKYMHTTPAPPNNKQTTNNTTHNTQHTTLATHNTTNQLKLQIPNFEAE
jgi:hypothetical protein